MTPPRRTRKTAEVTERTDEFLKYLQERIHELQTKRTAVMNEVRRYQENLSEIDRTIDMLTLERERRTRDFDKVPDFPPAQEPHEPIGPLERKDDGTVVLEEESFDEKAERLREETSPQLEDDLSLEGIHPKTQEYKKRTLKIVRNWWQEHKEGWFKTGVIAEDTGIPRNLIGLRCQDLMENHDMLLHRGNRASSEFAYNSKMPSGPTHHPRHDSPRTKDRGGAPVAHTRAKGRSGKPSYDKKRAARGITVKDKKK